ncbi:MAG: vitamin B12-dependent ribonucleotide reductase [Chloroflexi bacterium]|jgi:ribonucleoside-diphosphate reductase alpha chain|nr:vitamin B12-dependent ribonucleotide reductase [Chloroflexota bacterium]MBT4513607.1 vitamin B12-dependent ribonucleotide reductase [Chloroflexota bacterium]MBT5318515.1 vitamin B12-dependent ribonucleotide reductase [Chloroflexota bacterium]
MSTDTTRNGHDNTAATTEILTALKDRGLIQNITEAATLLGIAGAADNAPVDGEFVPATITDNANVVLEKRYLDKDNDGVIKEDPQGMFRRVAGTLAAADRAYGQTDAQIDATAEEFYQIMSSLEFLPNSPTMMNAGTGAGTLSACFVLPLKDSMEGIMGAAHDAAMVQKFGGGTGFALTDIRAKGTPIQSTHGRACGPIAVLRHLSSVSTLVTQGGKRDGANMAVMNVHHPDILEFIDCKTVEGEIHNFNISVGATDEFMQAVKDGTSYALKSKEDPAVADSPMVEVGQLDAREVFSKIVHGAWRNGEPGMIFLDEVNRNSPVLHLGEITATNPCGEQPLLPNESCNLGSIDVAKFIVEDADGNKEIDYDHLRKVTRLSVHFLDNVIDANKYAVPAIEEMANFTRKIGLGVMGFADMLVELGVPYDSDEAIEIGRALMAFIRDESDQASIDLAAERGPFPAFAGSKWDENGDPDIRNACRLTVAPTGTISMIAGCSSGIEPIFSLAFRKQNILEGQTLFYVDKNFERIARERGFYSEELLEHLSDGGSLQDREDVPEDVKRLFHVASDINPEYHVRMQAAFQESVDAGISKTINFPNDATVEDVETTYMSAWELKCKGITVYRAGSREKEVLTTGTTNTANGSAEAAEPQVIPQFSVPRDRPASLQGVTNRVRTGRGPLYVTVNVAADGRPFEMFATLGKAGGNDAAMSEGMSRLASLSLRSGVDPEEIIKQLRGITDVPVWDNGDLIRSVPDAISLVLDRVSNAGPMSAGAIGDSETAQIGMFEPPEPGDIGLISTRAAEATEVTSSASQSMVEALSTELCPDCNSSLAHEEGCAKCYSCGYSRC